MKRLFKWADDLKNKDTAFSNFVRFIYSVLTINYVSPIFNSLASIAITIALGIDSNNWKHPVFIIGIIILVLENIAWGISTSYKHREYTNRRFALKVLSSQSSLINSIGIEMHGNTHWKNTIFKKVSELVCEKIRNNFNEVLNCDTRVSIEYTFKKQQTNKEETHIKMSGRRSGSRDVCKKSVPITQRSKYYSYKIFQQNNKGVNILSEEDLQDNQIWYQNPSHFVNIKKYIGIAVSINDEEIAFVLQIDCLDNIDFGDNNDDNIKKFIDQYLTTYINIVTLSYLLNLNKYGEIPEV